jgi:hypothetical protein
MPRLSTLPLFIALACALAAPIGAQEPRLTVAPLVGRTDPSAIYDHTAVYPPLTGGRQSTTSLERLSVRPATSIGADVDFRITRSWVLSAMATRGSSTFQYIQRDEAGGLISESTEQGPAVVTSAALTIGRRLDVLPFLTYVDLYAGGALDMLDVQAGPGCGAPAPPPSNGGPYLPPIGCEDWHHRYSAPGIIGGAQLHRRLAEHWGVHAGGSYAMSRVNTRAFWLDLLPQYDQYEAPKSHRLHAVHLSLGVAYYR